MTDGPDVLSPPMTVAMTGASGFIGAHTAARLVERGHTVRALSRGGKPLLAGVTPFEADLVRASAETLAAFCEGADVLVHAAGEIQDEARMEALHVGATRRLAEAASGRVGRWVQLSSTGVYGPVRSGVVTEETPPAPSGRYEVTKWESDEIVRAAAAGGAFEAVVVRPSIVFGADMPNASLRQLVGAVRRGLFVFVGRPGASASYVHVADVAEALVACAERPEAAGRVYNVSGWATMEAFVGALARGAGVPAPSRRLPEGLARIGARLGDRVARIPLTTARVDALTGRARYASARVETELGVALTPIEMAAETVAAAWAAS